MSPIGDNFHRDQNQALLKIERDFGSLVEESRACLERWEEDANDPICYVLLLLFVFFLIYPFILKLVFFFD